MSLKYLFRAAFKDGSMVDQTQEDQSAHAAGKNAFYDVLQRIQEVAYFSMAAAEIVATVDLATGLFTLNGVTFQASDPSIPNLKGAEFRLVYFKQHRQHFSRDGAEVSHEIEYHIGWQTTIADKNYKQTIALT